MSYVRYIDKTREYYHAQGYEKAYVWAHNDTAPFATLQKPLSESRVALISTSEIAIRGETESDPTVEGQVGAVYGVPTDTPMEKLYSRTGSYDRFETHLDDINSFFPLTRLQEAVASGRIGALADPALGVFNAYSQRKTAERDAPEVLKRLQADRVDVAVLVPV